MSDYDAGCNGELPVAQLPKDSLLPCPFCGWEAEHKQIDDIEWPHVVKCSNCWAQTDQCPTPEGAAERWNMRVSR